MKNEQYLEQLEKLEKAIREVITRNKATIISNRLLPQNEEEKELVDIFNEILRCINNTLEEVLNYEK